MKLELIVGPMFSGKSSELIRRIRIARLIHTNDADILVVSHSSDTRYAREKIATHNNVQEDCVSLDSLAPLLRCERFKAASNIFIEEGQFFQDLETFVKEAVEKYHKNVTVSALDGTFLRKPFHQVINLIPFADDVSHFKAICMMCKDGTPAPFSMLRNVKCHSISGDIHVGGAEDYISVCRKHFIGNYHVQAGSGP